MSSSQPLGMGVAGIRGYAKGIAEVIRASGLEADPPARLVAVADPTVDPDAERIAELNKAGVTTYIDYDQMLADPQIEAVWLPLPIALHRPFTEQALAAGKAVMCEKPAAGTVDEVDAMIAARDRSGLPVTVGFQAIYDPVTAKLKRRLLDGVIGTIRRASIWGCWPRSSRYFARTDWAGKLKHAGPWGESWVLDSPLQNAMAHYVNLPLFLLGSDFQSSAIPTSVEAELYRAAPIENYDTVSARVQLEEGASLLLMLTHASKDLCQPIIRIEGDAGTVVWRARHGVIIETASGIEELPFDVDARTQMIPTFVRLVRGHSIEPFAAATLETARAHTVVVNGISEAAPVVSVPEAAVARITDDQKDEVFCTVPGIEAAFEQCAASWQMLGEAKALEFTRTPGQCDLRNYRHFAGPHPETTLSAESVAKQ